MRPEPFGGATCGGDAGLDPGAGVATTGDQEPGDGYRDRGPQPSAKSWARPPACISSPSNSCLSKPKAIPRRHQWLWREGAGDMTSTGSMWTVTNGALDPNPMLLSRETTASALSRSTIPRSTSRAMIICAIARSCSEPWHQGRRERRVSSACPCQDRENRLEMSRSRRIR